MQRFRSTLELATTTAGSVTQLTHLVRMTPEEFQTFRRSGSGSAIIVKETRQLRGVAVNRFPEPQPDGTYLLRFTTGI